MYYRFAKSTLKVMREALIISDNPDNWNGPYVPPTLLIGRAMTLAAQRVNYNRGRKAA